MVITLPFKGMSMKPGIYKREFGNDYKYVIYFPAGLGEAEEPSLIILLHWGGPMYPYKGLEILEGLGIPAWGETGSIIVAPDCPEVSGKWDCDIGESYILELTNYLQTEYGIRTDRTILAGYSKGGIGTWYIGGRNQDKFGRAIVVSARPPMDISYDNWLLPMCIIHSTDDEIFGLEDSINIVDRLKMSDVKIELKIVNGITHYDTYGFVGELKDANNRRLCNNEI